MWRDLKYLIAYILPGSAFVALYAQGAWSFSTVVVAFVCVPVLEQLLPQSVANLSEEEESLQSARTFFDLLLYLNVPILYAMLYDYFNLMAQGGLATYELVGLTLSVGITVGAIGINVGHELGHRARRGDQLLAQALLLPALYQHFTIEHNRGHHKNVATDLDPASARRGQTTYAFWWQSVTGGYGNAWALERERLERAGRPVLSWNNQMIRFTLMQVLWLAALGRLFGWSILPWAIAVAVIGFLLLETVNYIEHYGLRRRLLPSGIYEIVQPHHSWNSDHELGRIMLYELTRHSDHHYKANRKYQILRHFDQSPQLPFGYPASILLALAPPLWFRLMHPLLDRLESQNTAQV